MQAVYIIFASMGLRSRVLLGFRGTFLKNMDIEAALFI